MRRNRSSLPDGRNFPISVAAPNLTDAQLVELLGLVEQADSVELKLTVPESDQRSAVSALEMDPLDAQIRQVFFFDTPDLELYAAGVVMRARRTQGKEEDTAVKLRPVEPEKLSEEQRGAKGFGVEVDALPGGFVCSASQKAAASASVREVVAGDAAVGALFSKRQKALFTEHSPAGVELDDLSVLGPIFVLKLKFSPHDYRRKLVAELWLYPDYSAILELSTKCAPAEAFQVAAETRAFLSKRGVDLEGEQQTKTRKALEFFSARTGKG